MDGEHLVPLVERGGLDIGHNAVASAIDENVKASKRGHRAGYHTLPVILRTDIQLHEVRPITQLGGQSIPHSLISVRDDDITALFDEELDGRFANAAGTARDDSGSAFETPH
jgi:hypothetical protein